MIIPPFLKPGDRVGITCPASKMEREAAEYAASVIASWGLRVTLGETAGSHFHNFSGTDQQRLQELQRMLDEPDMRAIIFGRGGYGVIRLLDGLDFSQFSSRPQWLCGYSDITALHLHEHASSGIATIHSVMCSGITPETAGDAYVESLRKCLAGEELTYEFPWHPLNRPGLCQGEMIGGNLSLLANVSGTVSQPDTRGKILLLEDVGEYRYAVDRMLFNLKRSGWLAGLAGLVVGSFTDGRETTEPFGQTEQEIVWDKVKEYDYPVAFGFPAGHQKENYALRFGMEHRLRLEGQKASLCGAPRTGREAPLL
jgi:muramoyltetrapeptide carboxypeptidase